MERDRGKFDRDVYKRQEQKGTRPALVLSPKEVNRVVGHFICVPISQGANLNRTLGFTVSLIGTGLKTQGVVISDQIKAVDPVERNARFIETAPQYLSLIHISPLP